MILTSDKAYILTKQIKQRKVNMKAEFLPLANWMLKRYGTKPLNVMYDTIVVAYEQKPRLSVIFEYPEQEKLFLDSSLGYNKEKQEEIISFLGDSLFSNNRQQLGLLRSIHDYQKKLLVTFSSFAPLAVEEANGNIQPDEIELLKEQINNVDLWEIVKISRQAIFFFYNDFQVKKYSETNYRKFLSEKYYAVINKHDEFNYVNKYAISIIIDSKENFDRKYDSNWFYYFK